MQRSHSALSGRYNENLQVDWGKLPVEPQPKGLESQKVRKAVASALALLGTISFGAAVYLGYAFTAISLAALGACSGLALLALALGVASVVIFRMKSSFSDPDYCRARRLEVGHDIESNKLSYAQIRDKYRILLNKGIIHLEDLNIVLKSELSALNEEAFLKRHGEAVIDILNEENRQILKGQLLQKVKNHGCSYLGICKQHPIYSKMLNHEDINDIVREDAKGSYLAFIQRHGTEILRWLDLPNREAVKGQYLRNCIDIYQAVPQTQMGIIELMDRNASVALGIGYKDIKAIIDMETTMMIRSQGSIWDIVKRNGVWFLDEIESDAKKYFVKSFLEYTKKAKWNLLNVKEVFEDISSSSMHRINPMKRFEIMQICESLGINREILEEHVLENEIISFFNDPTHNDVGFKKLNGCENIERIVKGSPKLQGLIHERFKTLSYSEMTGVAKTFLAEIAGITEKTILEAINKDAEEMSYAGCNGFRAKHGLAPLEGIELYETLFSEKNRVKIAADLKAHQIKEYSDLNIYAKDMEILGLKRDEILKERWNSMTLLKIISALFEAEEFFIKWNKLFNESEKQEWSRKAVEETKKMKISEILHLSPHLFRYGLLTAESFAVGEESLKVRLKKELSEITSLEELMETYKSHIFCFKLIEREDPIIKALVEKFRQSTQDLISEGGCLAPDLHETYYNYIEENSLESNVIYKAILQEQVRIAKQRFWEIQQRMLEQQQEQRRHLQQTVNRLNYNYS
jgi:hypothetical protein